MRERREHERQCTPVTVEYAPDRVTERCKKHARDISAGGICLLVSTPMEIGQEISVRFPSRDISVLGRVAWQHREREGWSVGVEFSDQDTGFLVRMVEQVCQIQRYRAQVREEEGRELTEEEAAVEWIARYAQDFPPLVKSR